MRLGAFATAMVTAVMDGQCYDNGDGRQTTALVASLKNKKTIVGYFANLENFAKNHLNEKR